MIAVSYYDERPIGTLLDLLDQLRQIDAGAPFDIVVVVNQARTAATVLPERFSGLPIRYRPNAGFNVGAWQYAWTTLPPRKHYVFLQDECVIRRAGWLEAFIRAMSHPRTGFVGESVIYNPSWEFFTRRWPAAAIECRRLSEELNIPLGLTPSHTQTLAVGAIRDVLERTGGFITSDDKVTSIAGEVMTSVRARNKGFECRQISFRPFEYIEHPQWLEIKMRSRRFSFTLSRAAYLYLPNAINRAVRRA